MWAFKFLKMDAKAKTLESYNKHVNYYSEYHKGLLDLDKRGEFKRFQELLTGKKILDAGCGSGDHALYFVESGLDVECIDLSEKMMERCLQRGLRARVMDLEDLHLDENSFDGIWAVTSLLHIPKGKIRGVIGSLHCALKKEGILFVCLKKGEGEGMLADKHDHSTERFFAFWHKEEFLDKTKDFFDLIDFEERHVGKTIFLQFFFRKK